MREVAKRVFAKEYAESDLQERAGDTEYAPSYIITPTGAKCNRLFIIGVLTEVSDIGKDKELYRARVSDPTGEFLLYAGNFQPEATKFLSDAIPPLFVAVTGKSNLYEPDEETSITSIRPEVIKESNEIERDRWIVKTSEKTLKRINDVEEELKTHYDFEKQKYIDMIKKSLNSVVEEEQEEKTTEENEIIGETEEHEEKETEFKGKELEKEKEPKKEEKDDVEELDLTDL